MHKLKGQKGQTYTFETHETVSVEKEYTLVELEARRDKLTERIAEKEKSLESDQLELQSVLEFITLINNG